MNQHQNNVFAITLVALGLVAAPARAATLTQVPVSDWKGSITPPSYVQMYIYVPDKKATKPPIMVSAHSCGSTASGQMGNIPKIKAAADSEGFILILPDNPGQNCWDAGSTQALKHDGGSDTQAVAQMVKYTLSKYNGDASRVYIMGGSSGGILTQAMLGVYPDIFMAGSARAGVPAGCWGVQYDQGGTAQWSVPCANGTVTHTAQEWGDMVRAMYPGYTGHRPRVQIIQGEADVTIHFVANFAEGIKEWTNVLGLSATPTSTETGYQGLVASYNRQFWKNTCGVTVLETWSAPGKDHSMGYEEDGILKFFGLDSASTSDPEADCSSDAGVGGAGGASSTGGASNAGGTKATGSTASNVGGTKAAGGTASNAGGNKAEGGTTSAASATGGNNATGGTTGNVATSPSGGTLGTTTTLATATAAHAGGTNALSGGGAAVGGNSAVTNTSSSSQDAGGCGCRMVNNQGPGGSFAGLVLGLIGAGLGLRRRTRA